MSQFRISRNVVGWVLLVLGSITYCGLVYFGAANGPRGSDHFWYLADIRSLITDRGPVSNLVFPYTLLTEGYSGPGPFAHNILYPYLGSLPAIWLGPYEGAIFTNVVCHLIAAYLLFVTGKRVSGDPLIGALFSIIYLTFPLNFWLSINVLAESSTVPFVALLGTMIATRRLPDWRWIAVAIVIGLLIFARPSVALFAVMLPIAYLISKRPITFRTYVIASVIAAIIIGFSWSWSTYFPGNVHCPIRDRFNIMIPGQTSNMYCLYRLPDEPIMIIGWLKKVVHNLYRQFGFHDWIALLFYWPVNLMLGFSAWLLVKTRSPEVKKICWLSLGFGAVQIATLLLTQNQMRYLVLQVPLGLLTLGILVGSPIFGRLARHRYWVGVAAVLACIVVDLQFADRSRSDAARLDPQLSSLQSVIDQYISTDQRVVLESTEQTEDIETAIQINYSLDPRPTLMMPQNYDGKTYELLFSAFDPDVLLLRQDSPLRNSLTWVYGTETTRLPGKYSEYSLFVRKKENTRN